MAAERHQNKAGRGDGSGLLSVLIPFKNEREELALTCQSIRATAGDRVDIIVLNDDSDKDFDYAQSVEGLGVEYYESDHRLGSSGGKEWCVAQCRTPYFLILDAHCRMYTEGWLDKALAVLEKEEDCVYCCGVQYFSDETDHQSPKHMKAFGAFWDYNPRSILSCGWNVRIRGEEEFEVPCILGANYLCSKRWWDYLGGYRGLLLYGREETFISVKSWMAGGKVKCIPQILTGHKTRPGKHQPYRCCTYEVVHNEMVCAYVALGPSMFARLTKLWEKVHHPAVWSDAKSLFFSHIEELDELRRKFEKIKKVEHDEVDRMNAAFQKRIGFDYRKLKK